MKFLKNYKQGGESNAKTGTLGGHVYLSKKDEQDIVVALKRAFVKVSENPKNKGAEKFVVELEVVEIGQTQEGLEVGDVLSHMINLSPKNDLAVEPALKEFVSILSTFTGTSEKDYYKSLESTPAGEPSLLETDLEDDCAIGQGNQARITTPNDPKNGWYNLQWDAIEAAPAPKAKKAKAS